MRIHLPVSLPPPAGRWAIRAGKLALSLALLYLALRRVPLSGLWTALTHARPVPFAASLALFLVGMVVLEPLRYGFAGRLVHEPRIPLREWFLINLRGRAFLYLAPAGVGQEGYLWWQLRRSGWKHASCAYVAASARGQGVALWTAALALALADPVFRGACRVLRLGGLLAPLPWTGVTLVLLLGSFLLPGLMKRFGRLELAAAPGPSWAAQLAASLGIALAATGSLLLACRAFRLDLPPVQAAGSLALLYLGMVLPISLAGLGLQEAILLLVGQGLGLPPSPILGVSLALHLQRLGPTLLGLVTLLGAPPPPSPQGRSSS